MDNSNWIHEGLAVISKHLHGEPIAMKGLHDLTKNDKFGAMILDDLVKFALQQWEIAKCNTNGLEVKRLQLEYRALQNVHNHYVDKVKELETQIKDLSNLVVEMRTNEILNHD